MLRQGLCLHVIDFFGLGSKLCKTWISPWKWKKAAIFKLSSAVPAACKGDQTCSLLMVLHTDGTELAGRSGLLSATRTFESVFFSPFMSEHGSTQSRIFSMDTRVHADVCVHAALRVCTCWIKVFWAFFAYRNRNPWLFGKIKKTMSRVLPSGLITCCIKWEILNKKTASPFQLSYPLRAPELNSVLFHLLQPYQLWSLCWTDFSSTQIWALCSSALPSIYLAASWWMLSNKMDSASLYPLKARGKLIDDVK